MPDLTDERSPWDQPERPAPRVPAVVDDHSPQRSPAVVVRRTSVPARTRWSRRVATLAARLPDIARNPAVLATAAVTATVASEVAVGMVRRGLGGRSVGRGGPPSGTMHIGGVVVHHVHVIHHHVVHVVEPRAATSA